MPIILIKNHENTSKAPPKSKPSSFNSRQPLKKLIICDHPSVIVVMAPKPPVHHVLILAIKALIKISDMLRAKTVTTGAKITWIIFARLK